MLLGGLTTAVTKSRFSTYEYRCKKFSLAPSLMLQVVGDGGGVFSPKCKLRSAERTSMVAHIYPWVLQALAGWGDGGYLEG